MILLTQSIHVFSNNSPLRSIGVYILYHLKGAQSYEIQYCNHGHSCIECFSDVDWVGFEIGRRSTMNYYVFVEGNLILWKSEKHNVVS